MKKHKGRNIASKITTGIVNVALLCSLIIGLAGIVSVAIINNQLKQLYSQNLVPMEPIYNVGTDFLNLNIMLQQVAYDSNTSEFEFERDSPKIYSDLLSQLKIYKKSISTTKENSNYKDILSNLTKYKDDMTGVVQTVKSGQTALTEMLMSGDTSFISSQLKTEINNAFTMSTQRAKQREQTSSILFWCDIFALIAVAAALIYYAIRIGNRIAKSISEPINKMVESAGEISKGNLDVDLIINSGDETEVLAEAFEKIVLSLRLLKSDVSMLISHALEGSLNTRADSSRHEGDYKEIINGVNDMLDTIKAPLDVATDFINGLADGDYQNDIENKYKGYYADLINNLNRVSRSINILVSEAAKLNEAGVSGDLDVRGDYSKLKGVYADIIVGVNRTFDAIKEPLDIASGYIAKMADGEDFEILEHDHKGYYAKLINNLDSVRESLSTLLCESLKLTKAGESGELSIRGDETKVKGNYSKIISGFNKALESIVIPLNEAGSVLGKMALNDFTTPMPNVYNGMLKELAESINSVRERMRWVENILTEVGQGSLDSLDDMIKVGKLSKNDNLVPSLISMMMSIRELIGEANKQSSAAIDGDLSFRGDESKFEGEYRHIILGMNKTMEAFAAPIEEAANVLQELAQKNLKVGMSGEYKGEYNRIKMAMNQTIASFDDFIGKINITADQVAVGSRQISDSSQLLAHGAGEQAGAVEELTYTIKNVAEQTKKNEKYASKAYSLESTVQEQALQGNEKMNQMLDSMHQISNSSSSISKIIRVIEDIAFQTNILALNAAVEAARAGDAGRGFSVVASEVKNLAVKSAKAANETEALIQDSIAKVGAGTKIANETAVMLTKISESVKKAADYIGNITTASEKQTIAISQIDQRLFEVSNIVQSNSATAEESASSSEEFSSQAESLKEMVGMFKLKDSAASSLFKDEKYEESFSVDNISENFQSTEIFLCQELVNC